jgi:4-amino-4-deoxy-L-arabinose transferase-like glycosyltransferase
MRFYHWFFRHPLWLLIGVAFMVRILPATVRFVIGSDEGLFLTLGQNLAAGRGYTGDGLTTQIDFPPGFPLFAAAIYGLGGGLELPAKLNILMMGALLPLPIYWLTRQLSDARTALLAGLFTALHPALVLSQGNFESVAEQPYSLLLYTAWGLLWWGLAYARAGLPNPALGVDLQPKEVRPEHFPTKRLVQRRLWVFGLAGVLVGLAHLVRWEGVILGVVAAGIILLALRRAAIRPLLFFLTGLALFALPYAFFLYQHTGSILSPKTMLTQLHAAAIDASVADPYAIEKYFFEPYEIWLANPVVPPPMLQENRLAPLQRYVGNVWLEIQLWFTSFAFMTILWLAPFLFGLWAMGRRQTLFLLPLFIPLAFIPASVVDPRYFLIPLPILMIFTARGWTWLIEKLPRLKLSFFTLPVSLATILVAGTLAFFLLADLVGPFLYPRPTEYRTAGLALRDQLPPGARILARKRQLPFYTGGVWVWLPFAELDGVLDYAESHQIDYLVLDRYTTPNLRPQLVYLLDPAKAPANLAPVYVGDRVVVYQMIQPNVKR